MKPVISLLLSLVFAVTLLAQKEEVTVETSFPSTLLRAEELPLPDYPEIAKNAALGGRVSVDITLNNEGWVLTAENPRGPHPVCQSVTDPKVLAMRDAAVAAARKARFEAVGGQSTLGMTGRISYIFVADPKTGPAAGAAKEMRLDRVTRLGISDTVARVADTGQAVVKESTDNKEMRIERITTPVDSDSGVRVMAPGETYPKGTTDQSTQAKIVTQSKIVSGGVLNGKALALPKPSYPPAAKAVRASGSVAVQVLILEDGSVYSAAGISGHPLLRANSEIAACGSKFTPTLLVGNPVKVSGVIVYNFIP